MAEKTNLVLVGMPGAGKSTLGVVVAKILGYDFVDGDILIQHEQDATLQQLIDTHGPEGFLAIENKVLSALDVQRCVVSTGGSAIYSEEAMAHLAANGVVAYLRAPLEEIAHRVGPLAERGVVMRAGLGNDFAALYAERVPLYERWADVVVDVAGREVRPCAIELVEKFMRGAA